MGSIRDSRRTATNLWEGAMPVTVSVVRETAPKERRVALVPEVAKTVKALGANVGIQSGAGDPTQKPDIVFGQSVEVGADASTALSRARSLFTVSPPTRDEIAKLREGASV